MPALSLFIQRVNNTLFVIHRMTINISVSKFIQQVNSKIVVIHPLNEL